MASLFLFLAYGVATAESSSTDRHNEHGFYIGRLENIADNLDVDIFAVDPSTLFVIPSRTNIEPGSSEHNT